MQNAPNHKNPEKTKMDNYSYHDYLQSVMWTHIPPHSNEKVQTLSGQKRGEKLYSNTAHFITGHYVVDFNKHHRNK